MQCRQGAVRDVTEERELQTIHMKMQNVEFIGHAADPVEHQHGAGYRVGACGVQPGGAVTAGHQGSGR